MKHNIRTNGQIQTIDCELGTGFLDENGKEIFEGDKIKFNDYDAHIELIRDCFYVVLPCAKHPLDYAVKFHQVEVVGHADD